MAGELPQGHVVLFDDDHYYMGGLLPNVWLPLDVA